MNEIERRQIKGALEECADENENKITPTCYIRIADVCRAGAERIKELEKENDELKAVHESDKKAIKLIINKAKRDIEDEQNKFDKLTKSVLALICWNSEKNVKEYEEKIYNLAKFFEEIGKIELAEYALAQIGVNALIPQSES